MEHTKTPDCQLFYRFAFFPPRRCVSLSRGKKKVNMPPLAAPARLDCTTLRDGFMRCGFFRRWRGSFFIFFFLLWAFSGIETKPHLMSRAFFFFLRCFVFFCFFYSKDVILFRRGGGCWYTAATTYLSKWTDPALTNCHSRKIRQPPLSVHKLRCSWEDTPEIFVYLLRYPRAFVLSVLHVKG